MKIGLKHFYPFAPFFLNLAHYLETLGHEIVLLNPQAHVAILYGNFARCIYYESKDVQEIFAKEKLDRLILWNGVADEPEIRAAELNGVTTWFAENGYFQNTFQLNKQGVNAQADYARLSAAELLNFSYPDRALNFSRKVEPLDVNFSWAVYVKEKCRYLFTGKALQALHQIGHAIAIRCRKKYTKLRFLYGKSDVIDFERTKPFIFFPLQVNSDTQITFNSPYSDMFEILDAIVPLILSTRYNLVIKEHPAELERVNYLKYRLPGRVFVAKRADLSSLIDESEFVITVNSSVGLQALERDKKVLVLGRAMYETAPAAVRCDLLTDNLLEKMQLLAEHSPDWRMNKRLVEHFRRSIFLTGDWRKPDNLLLNKCARRILA